MSSPPHATWRPDPIILPARAVCLRSPTERWVELVALVALASEDTATIDEWAARAHLPRPLLCARCRAAAARPKHSVDLGRLIRVVRVGTPVAWSPEDFLNITDERTVKQLLIRGGLDRYHHQNRPPLAVLFREHRLVVPSTGVVLLREMFDHPAGV